MRLNYSCYNTTDTSAHWAGYESAESADELAIMNVSQVSDGFIFNSCKAAVRLLRLIMFFPCLSSAVSYSFCSES